ncbi:major facilitator superfamily domain-containing protein 12-like [Onthophagus taurus]|uniref:major facilitator superfamily domain-containing protein 12-like n=1 Tax=Onthophagus taurus TaxID=166361 RepID=UPI000C2087CA|nr:major facilitator superfamily domain-containing protein 12-like [Onthophagus taurus]
MDGENAPLLNQISPLNDAKLFFYGLGHVYNDLCAAVWFSYTLFYFQIILEIEPTTAGSLMMLGQVADSLATPVCGWAIDRLNKPKAWHKAGTAAVAVGFCMIFSLKPTLDSWKLLIYHTVFVIIFQIGWAIVQISHLSLIPAIAIDQRQSSNLTTVRYTASVCCNIFVYLLTWIVLQNGENPNNIGPKDIFKFQELIFIITALGVCTSSIFYCGIPQPNFTSQRETPQKVNKNVLKKFSIYTVSLMYMSSRLCTILNLIYVPLYLEERYSNGSDKDHGIRSAVAVVPLVSFCASLFASILLRYKPKQFGHRLTYLVGSIFCLGGSGWIAYGIPLGSYNQLYAAVSFTGIGGSATMVSSLCLTADFIKINGYGGGFVYSAVTFADKILSGGVVLLIQYLQCSPKNLCPLYYEAVLAYACSSSGILGLFSLMLLSFEY